MKVNSFCRSSNTWRNPTDDPNRGYGEAPKAARDPRGFADRSWSGSSISIVPSYSSASHPPKECPAVSHSVNI
jgi:hypothetical protein